MAKNKAKAKPTKVANSSKPAQAPNPHEEQKPLGPADGSPFAIPTEEVLNVPASTETEEEKLARMERESEINKVAPEPETNLGKDTTGVGQPGLQAANQGQSLPPAAIPVEKKFETDQFHNPQATENAVAEKDQANRGGKKADF